MYRRDGVLVDMIGLLNHRGGLSDMLGDTSSSQVHASFAAPSVLPSLMI